jgi:hypothetical protein
MVFDIGVVLAQWQSIGIFAFVLPFILIFAIVFGILSGTKAFGDKKAVHVIIAIAIGLFAIQLPFVRDFFPEIFSRLGVALAVMVVFWILVMVFVEETHRKWVMMGFWILGAIVALLVVFNTFNELNFFGSNWWGDWGGLMIGALLVIGVIIAISVSGGSEAPAKK